MVSGTELPGMLVFPLDRKKVIGYYGSMKPAKKKEAKTVEIDARGRFTLPKSLRGDATVFAAQKMGDGTIKLVPQQNVSLSEAELLDSLRLSLDDFRKGKTKKVPKEWLE